MKKGNEGQGRRFAYGVVAVEAEVVVGDGRYISVGVHTRGESLVPLDAPQPMYCSCWGCPQGLYSMLGGRLGQQLMRTAQRFPSGALTG